MSFTFICCEFLQFQKPENLTFKSLRTASSKHIYIGEKLGVKEVGGEGEDEEGGEVKALLFKLRNYRSGLPIRK